MIEDPQLTLKILEYFAREDVGWPANKTFQDVSKMFPEESGERIQYHIICAIEGGLLKGTYRRTSTFQGVHYSVGTLDGLTKVGGDYVRKADSPLWNQAKDLLANKGLALTTSHMLEAMDRIFRASFS